MIDIGEAGANMTSEKYLMNKFFKNKIDTRILPAINRQPVVVEINYVLVSMISVVSSFCVEYYTLHTILECYIASSILCCSFN